MKKRLAASHNEKIIGLKKLKEHFGSDWFEIKLLSIQPGIRNLLYYNRVVKKYIEVDGNGRIKFPFHPNYEGMCEVYYEMTKNYNRSARVKKVSIPLAFTDKNTSLSFPEFQNSLSDQLLILKKNYGDDDFFKCVSLMLHASGYSGELVKKNVLKIG
jgi:hypothetical protein